METHLKRTRRSRLGKQELETLSKEDLVNRILQLEAHNLQLSNILSKRATDTADDYKNQKQFDFSKARFRHVLLKLYYLGWDYQGFATQEDSNNTIEHHLFAALQKTCLIKDRESSNYHRCGRTDKGVSGFSQVISIDLRSKYPESEQNENMDNEIPYCKLLNRVLPKEIQCYSWCPVPKDFSARFDCNKRTYKYFFPRGNLNVEAMREASTYLIGSHDFRNFCKMDVGNGVVEFIREIQDIYIEKIGSGDDNPCYDMFVITIVGKSFLWHQIRCFMGILLLIGQEKEDPDVIKSLLNVDSNPRKPQYSLANEVPLNLFHCNYDCSLKWFVDTELHNSMTTSLQHLWTFQSVKCSMIREMLKEFDKPGFSLQNQSECLIQGVKSKRYVKLLNRPTCESLEEKIHHYTKKRKVVNGDGEEMG